MRFSMSHTLAIMALRQVERTSGKQSSSGDHATFVLIQALESGDVVLTTHDGIKASEVRVQVAVHEPGKVLIPVRSILRVVQAFRSEISFVFEDEQLQLYSGAARFLLNVVNPSDEPFQLLYETSNGAELSIPSRDWHALCASVSYAISSSELASPQTTGMRVDGKDGRLSVVSTDGHRLAVAQIGHPCQCSALIPRRSVLEMERIAKLSDGDAKISMDKYVMTMSVENEHMRMFFSTRLLAETEYPTHETVMSSPRAGTCVLFKADLVDSLRRIKVFTTEKFCGVIFRILPKSGVVKLTNQENGKGRCHEELEISQHSGDSGLEMMCNINYVIEALKPVTGDRVHLEYSQALQPLFVHGEQDWPLGIIMPMRR